MSLYDDRGMAVAIPVERYEELLHKETTLEIIKTLHTKMPDYAFRDAVGFMLKQDKVKADE